MKVALVLSVLIHGLLFISVMRAEKKPDLASENVQIEMNAIEKNAVVTPMQSKTSSARKSDPARSEEKTLPVQNVATTQSEIIRVIQVAQGTNSAPHYPKISRARGEQGRVLISVKVKSDGSAVSEPVVVQSSGYSTLDQAALNAVKSWKFSAHLFGDLDLEIPFVFKLAQ